MEKAPSRFASRLVFFIALSAIFATLGGCQPSLFQKDNRTVQRRAIYFPDSETVQHEDQQRRAAQGVGLGSPMGPAGY